VTRQGHDRLGRVGQAERPLLRAQSAALEPVAPTLAQVVAPALLTRWIDAVESESG
jgi:hypothetical protein